MRLVDTTQPKINFIVRGIKGDGTIHDEADRDKLHYTDLEGRRDMLGSPEAKSAALLKTYQEHGYLTTGWFHMFVL